MQQSAAFLLQDRAVSVSEPDCSQDRSCTSVKLTREKKIKITVWGYIYVFISFFHLKIGFNNRVNGTAGEEWAKHLLHFGISVLSRVWRGLSCHLDEVPVEKAVGESL